MNIIHITDLHLRSGWIEEQGLVLNKFFEDCEDKISEETLLIFSGDLVQSGGVDNHAAEFSDQFAAFLDRFPLENRVCCPGNHDVDRDYIAKNQHLLESLAENIPKETDFNNSLRGDSGELIKKKFIKINRIQEKYFGCRTDGDNCFGKGYDLDSNVGIYCLNTALYSFGGLSHTQKKEPINDKGYLPIDTRSIHSWLSDSVSDKKILVMHHPLDWLTSWAQRELKKIIAANFDLVLCGHTHELDISSQVSAQSKVPILTAPCLFQRKQYINGYSIIDFSEVDGPTRVKYRAWSQSTDSFVVGASFTGTDCGSVALGNGKIPPVENKLLSIDGKGALRAKGNATKDPTFDQLVAEFNASLQCHLELPAIWVSPEIADTPEHSGNQSNANIFTPLELLETEADAIISAPPQFGLTSMARHMAVEHYKGAENAISIYIDFTNLPSHKTGIIKHVEFLKEKYDSNNKIIENFLLDNFDGQDNKIDRKINEIKLAYPDARLIIFSSVDSNFKKIIYPNLIGNFSFKNYFLKSYSREKIRLFVQEYINSGSSIDEDLAVSRLVSHLENMNLPRTPLNCLTLLKVFDSLIDSSPVNRTELFEKFLQILFNSVTKIPRYSTIPDLKDSLYSVGYFCDWMIRNDRFSFSKKEFIDVVNTYCSDQLISLEVDILFGCLTESRLFIFQNNRYLFRFTHWFYFFAAHRMHQDQEFYEFIVADQLYFRYPEVIEFFSGIDRRRTELVSLMASDLRQSLRNLDSKFPMSDALDPFQNFSWEPDHSDVEQARTILENHVNATDLSTEIKDAIADRTYSAARPYDQSVRQVLDDAVLLDLTRSIDAASRALRNSDHANVEERKKLFRLIVQGWKRVAWILFFVSPIFARDGRFSFGGVSYHLKPEIDGSDAQKMLDEIEPEDKWLLIVCAIPLNLSIFFGENMYSPKMVPVYRDFIDDPCEDEFSKYIMTRELVLHKAKGFQQDGEKGISKLKKNSFYLADLARTLKVIYETGFNTEEEVSALRSLIGQSYGKHFRNIKSRNKRKIADMASAVLDNSLSDNKK